MGMQRRSGEIHGATLNTHLLHTNSTLLSRWEVSYIVAYKLKPIKDIGPKSLWTLFFYYIYYIALPKWECHYIIGLTLTD